jgi:hypothetical protein
VRGGSTRSEVFARTRDEGVTLYRFVVIRRPQAEDPTDQLTLFTVKSYTYQLLVTNLICDRSTSGGSTTTECSS